MATISSLFRQGRDVTILEKMANSGFLIAAEKEKKNAKFRFYQRI